MPYAGMTNAETKQSVINRGYRMPPPSGCPEQVSQLMHECWQYHEKVGLPLSLRSQSSFHTGRLNNDLSIRREHP